MPAPVLPHGADGKEEGGQQQAPYRAHIDFRFIKSNLDMVRHNARMRNSGADADAVVRLYDAWVELLEETERLRAQRNANAKAMKVRRLNSELVLSAG